MDFIAPIAGASKSVPVLSLAVLAVMLEFDDVIAACTTRSEHAGTG